jgi:hypothetical protein
MRKHKKRWEEANSWHTIYPVVPTDTKPPLVHVVEALHTKVLLPRHQVSHKSTTWLTTKTHHEGTRQAPLVTLMPPPLRSFSSKGRVSPRPRTKCARHSTPSWRVEDDCRWATRHQGFRRTLYKTWFTQESPHKVDTPCTHSALS